ncbi:hypothetical protein DPEC_G00296710 [Dallia pectoralis]|uniref:Uncharacterized protein n=1 Tax=Dallia pectoralis TaxID=75939 RepID=A0ACC2FFJ9_DALPE|nr:hypothetical protein DPEC_G00296710 [Dallia pectoralis]
MDTVSTLFLQSTDSSKSETIENYEGFGPDGCVSEPPSPGSMSTALRRFGNPVALCASPGGSVGTSTMFRECTASHNPSLITKSFLDRPDPVPWTEVDISRAKEVLVPHLVPPGNMTPNSTSYPIKDETERSHIMENSQLDRTTDIPSLDTGYEPDIKQQQLGYMENSGLCFSPSGSGHKLGLLEGSPKYLVDLNQTRTESRVPPTHLGKGPVHYDLMRSSGPVPQQHVMIYKSEMPRWSVHTSPTQSPFWCQSSGVSDDQYPPHGYPSTDGIHTSALLQRSPTYTGYGGIPPHRLCMICGDEASGCHYGVLTCGSCKVFFKRAVEGHHNYLCAGRNDCIVDKIRRKNCPACRLRKCYQAGMMLGGRKLKRFGALKALGLAPSLQFQGPLVSLEEGQSSVSCLSGFQLSPQMINILESIEPEMVYSGYDNSQPDMPNVLLTSLNRLCERQLLWIVRWSKSLPGFRSLHINDQMNLIQYSWMNLLVFSLGWRSFQNVTSEYLYFAPDLILSQDRMRRSPIYDLCLAIQFIPQEFASLQVSREEYLCMKAIMILNTVPLEGLKSQAQFEEMRQNYIRELTKAIHLKEKGLVASSQRFYHLTKLMDAMHEIVKKVNLYCLSTYIQADSMKVEFPEMMSEVISSQLPKVLAGMVKPLLFHSK